MVAEQVRKEAGTVSDALSIDDVFAGLQAIAQTNGKGAVEKRIAKLAELLKRNDR